MRFVLLIYLLFCGTLSAQTVTLEISNIRNAKGKLRVSVFENPKQFEDEVPAKSYTYNKSSIKQGKKSITLKLPAGTYGITVLDDEDENNNMTYRIGIYPLEGVGFTNFYLSGMTKPDFEDFDFMLSGNQSKSIAVKMRYF